MGRLNKCFLKIGNVVFIIIYFSACEHKHSCPHHRVYPSMTQYSLRGGMPFILGDLDDDAKYSNYDEDERVKVFHVFSRIHGDLERDYNAFYIDDSYFSQGHVTFVILLRTDVMM